MLRKLLIGSALASLALTSVAVAQTAPPTPTFGSWGFDAAGRNLAVKPGDDFFAYANGRYMDAMQIAPDRSTGGVWIALVDLAEANTRAIVDDAVAGRLRDADAARIAAAYTSFMDEARVEQLDAQPLRADLEAVRAAADKAAIARLMGQGVAGFGGGFFEPGVETDLRTPTANVLYLGQGGLNLPDRDYYLKPAFAEQKAKYQAYVAQMLGLISWPEAEKRAADILALETRIAEASWPAEERRDLNKIYNPTSFAELERSAPGFPWAAYAEGAGLADQPRIVVSENTAFPKIAAIFAETPLEVLKAWQAFTITDEAAPYLSRRFVDARFEFRGKALSGQQEQRPRWKRGIGLVNGAVGEAVGRIYVGRHFPPDSKAKMDELVAGLTQAMDARIDALAWMSPATKAEAHRKLANFRPMIGYPDKFRDYSALTLRPDDLYGNVKRSDAFEWDYQRGKLSRPVDKGEWGLLPHTVNAQYHPVKNYIIFPAAILMPPFFNPSADPAINYGAIGGVIGHEITHGFDDQGRKTDSTGALRDWWTKEDAVRFEAAAKALSAQYGQFEPLPGMRVNGDLTLGENIADLGGLLLGLDAYKASLKGKPAPVIDGLTGEQRVFLGWAQAWRERHREPLMRQLIAADPHSPPEARVNGPLRNIDAWYKAFDVKPGEKLYIAPEQRVRLW